MPDSNSEFEFCISRSTERESSSADELFFNGVILPTCNREAFTHSRRFHQCEIAPFASSSLPPLPPAAETHISNRDYKKEVMDVDFKSKKKPPAAATNTSKKDNRKELMAAVDYESEKKGWSKSFWGFRRSNSLTHESRKTSFCSLPLLFRSNSTGSTPKRTPLKQSSESKPKSSFSSTLFSNSATNSYSKLRKSHSRKKLGGSYGNNIIPILNIPPPYITTETADISGLSSLLRNGKDKKSRK